MAPQLGQAWQRAGALHDVAADVAEHRLALADRVRARRCAAASGAASTATPTAARSSGGSSSMTGSLRRRRLLDAGQRRLQPLPDREDAHVARACRSAMYSTASRRKM